MIDKRTIPTKLAIVSVHPDYLDVCLKECCTGVKFPPKMESGTVTLFRRTSGGLGGKHYGVVGVWCYTGQVSVVRPGTYRWPRRWAYRMQFEPLVLKFETPFCETFTEALPDPSAWRGLKMSAKVPGLIYTALQGSLVQVKDAGIAAAYLRALLKEKAEELRVNTLYQGQPAHGDELLSKLAAQLKKAAAQREEKRGRLARGA